VLARFIHSPISLMNDEITLTIPRSREYLTVAHLVLGGIGIRLNLTIETLEDLQLALDAVLERDREPGEVTIAVRLAPGAIETEIGPLRDGVRRELDREPDDEVGLRRILDTLVDTIDVSVREGGLFLTMRKSVTEEAA
jgi:anti-sigma regulatory factor (Ser/Thr protein kinase)